VDIEGYCTHTSSNCTGTDSKGSLTALIAELAAELKAWHPSSQLSFALSAFPGSQSSFYDHLALSRLIAYVFVMAYDEWPFEAFPNATRFAAANSDLRTLYTAVASYTKIGVAPSKLVMGLPWYGYDFVCDDASDSHPPEGAPCLVSTSGKTPIKERAVLDQQAPGEWRQPSCDRCERRRQQTWRRERH
jgi:di-N-acetylchitobiase